MEKQNIRIKLRAYDNKILDASTEEIVNTVKRTGATIKGPIPLQNNGLMYAGTNPGKENAVFRPSSKATCLILFP